jgi:mono/diheme cytochrome c family protein
VRRAHAALLVIVAACGEKADVIDWLRMKDQAKAMPYGESEYFADGRAMRVPPAGTMPRERLPNDDALATGMIGDAYVPTIPVPVDLALLTRGRERFDITCAACHGLVGDGDSEVARNMRLRRPPSLHEPRIRAYPPGRIYRTVAEGFGLMPSYRMQLSVRDRWAVVAYVRALQLSQGVKLASLPPDLQAAARGAP